ncbi:MAG: hypothetical protein IPG76_05445 [Acidobacteria bacterium]|nr:hypothetical protein [Acidobacteriota bacterium]
MDALTLKVALTIGLLMMLLSVWLVWKFFFPFLKYAILLLLLVIAGSGFYIYRMIPRRNPAIGRHAYLSDSGKYLGVVEGSGEDNTRGEVWIVRPPGRYPVIYSKSRVVLKDKREIDREPRPSPPTPAPSQTPAPKKPRV